jgi:hypothetical protein
MRQLRLNNLPKVMQLEVVELRGHPHFSDSSNLPHQPIT